MEYVVFWHELEPDIKELYRPYFRIITLHINHNNLELRDELQGAALNYPPQNVIAIVVTASQTEAQLDRLHAWRETFQVEAPVVTHTVSLVQALAHFSSRVRRNTEITAQLMLRLAESRIIHEELQNSYESVRSYISMNGLIPPRLGFINPPDLDGVVLPEAVIDLLQPIPLELRSLCGISLHLGADVPKFSEGKLIVELLAVDDDAIFFSWQADYKTIPIGWVTFAFEQSSRFLRKSPIIRLRYETESGHGPLFSLGFQQLRCDKAATINGEAGVRSLAFKAWTSIPGAPLNLSSQMWPIIRIDSRPITQIELTIDETLPISDTLNIADLVKFTVVVLVKEQSSILVHPVENETTLARIYEACPSGAATVIAEVETRSDKAGHIEYALAVLWPEEAEMVGKGSILPATARVSDWLALPPQTPGALHLSLERPLSRPADLYLMTRLPPGQTADYCWAHFKRISFRGQFS